MLSGCIGGRSAVIEKNLMADRSSQRSEGVEDCYRVAYPDVLELVVAERPELCGRVTVDLGGRIRLGPYGEPRVQGRTTREIAEHVASLIQAAPADVQVRVADYRSRNLYLFGQVVGWQRAIPYQGQESVLDVLQRVGGITPGAEPEDVYVVRAHVAEAERPEIFRIRLADIVMKRDHATNIRLQPDDQIFVGETRQYRLEKCIPPWLRPLYHTLCGVRPKDRMPR